MALVDLGGCGDGDGARTCKGGALAAIPSGGGSAPAMPAAKPRGISCRQTPFRGCRRRGGAARPAPVRPLAGRRRGIGRAHARSRPGHHRAGARGRRADHGGLPLGRAGSRGQGRCEPGDGGRPGRRPRHRGGARRGLPGDPRGDRGGGGQPPRDGAPAFLPGRSAGRHQGVRPPPGRVHREHRARRGRPAGRGRRLRACQGGGSGPRARAAPSRRRSRPTPSCRVPNGRSASRRPTMRRWS